MVDIIPYGAIENAFTLAASFVIQNEDIINKLILLDGDRYITPEEKVQQINKKLTGTEIDADEKRDAALSIIQEFILPEGISPEQFIHDMIIKSFPEEHEMYTAALEIKAVSDTHEWVYGICEKLGEEIPSIIREVFIYAWEDEAFQTYLEQIYNWLELKRKNT